MSDFHLEFALRGDLEAWVDRNVKAFRTGLEVSVREAATEELSLLRADVENAGLGRGLANAWRLDVYYNRDTGQPPAAFLHSNAAPIIDAFEKGGRIGAKDGGAMAIPIPGSPAASMRLKKGEHLVASVEAKFGPLQLVVTPRGAMLVAKGRQTKTGALRPLQTRVTKSGGAYTATGGVASIPMFWLTRDIRLEKRLGWRNIAAAARGRFQGRVEDRLRQRLEAPASTVPSVPAGHD